MPKPPNKKMSKRKGLYLPKTKTLSKKQLLEIQKRKIQAANTTPPNLVELANTLAKKAQRTLNVDKKRLYKRQARVLKELAMELEDLKRKEPEIRRIDNEAQSDQPKELIIHKIFQRRDQLIIRAIRNELGTLPYIEEYVSRQQALGNWDFLRKAGKNLRKK